MGQWLDAAVITASFHMQCAHYDKIKPPSLFKHPDTLSSNCCTDRDFDAKISSAAKPYSPYRRPSISASKHKRHSKSIVRLDTEIDLTSTVDVPRRRIPFINPILGHRIDGGWGMIYTYDNNVTTSPLYSDIITKYIESARAVEIYSALPIKSSWARNKTPSLFLQELAHLSSLCVAVSFCTLRNNATDSCLDALRSYVVHQPWPPANPFEDAMLNHIGISRVEKCKQILQFFFGVNRFSDQRVKYVYKRPLMVLGGISKNELVALRRAKGASAKVTLVWYWLSEFITREHLAGTLGDVGSPIVSRVHQFLSDGMKE